MRDLYTFTITKPLELEWISEGHLVQLPCDEQRHRSYIGLSRAQSSLALQVSIKGASRTTWLMGGAVPDTTLMQTRERVPGPEMLNGQCILLQLMHEGSNGRRSRKRACTM